MIKEGYRKIAIGFVFLIVGIAMIFIIRDESSKQIFFDYLWKLCAVLIGGNGIEWIGKGIAGYKRNKFNDIGE